MIALFIIEISFSVGPTSILYNKKTNLCRCCAQRIKRITIVSFLRNTALFIHCDQFFFLIIIFFTFDFSSYFFNLLNVK